MEKSSLKAYAVQTSDNVNVIVVGDSLIDALLYLDADVYSKIVSVQTINADAYVVGCPDKEK